MDTKTTQSPSLFDGLSNLADQIETVKAFKSDPIPITLGQQITRPADLRLTDLSEIANDIKSEKLIALITPIRSLYKEYTGQLSAHPELAMQLTKDYKPKMNKLKQSLPYFMMVTFVQGMPRANANVKLITGAIIDIDLPPQQNVEDVINLLRDNILDACLIFASPSHGIKIVFVFQDSLVVNDDNRAEKEADYKLIYGELSERITRLTGYPCDHTSDPARACFLSADKFAVRRNARLDNVALLRHVQRDLSRSNPSSQDKSYDTYPPVQRDLSRLDTHSQDKSYDTYHQSGTFHQSGTYHRPRPDAAFADDYSRASHIITGLAQKRIDYHDWIRIGMALYIGFGERGKGLWDIFLYNPCYHETQANLDRQWRSFRNTNKVNLATLFYIGGKYGICQ